MSINEQLLAAFVSYGLPVLFGVTLLNAVGIPLPGITFVLVLAGSFTQLGEMNLWWVMALATCGAVLGDQIGYAIGRWGGRRLVLKIVGWLGGDKLFNQAEAIAAKWGGFGIFLSRWLITPLGPVFNITSGITAYSYPRFLLWEIPGEVVWVILYVLLGKLFSDRVQALIDTLGNLTWVAIGLIAALFFGNLLFKNLPVTRKIKEKVSHAATKPVRSSKPDRSELE